MTILFWWSVIGLMLYQAVIIVSLKNTRVHVRLKDLLTATIFGPIAVLAVIMAKLVLRDNKTKERRGDDKN